MNFLNIVIPMAGLGSRFKNAGYVDPKPLIKIFNRDMIDIVISNLTPKYNHRFIFIVQEEQVEKYNLESILKKLAPRCIVIKIDYLTSGQLSSVMLAKEYIKNNDPVMIANCDQYLNVNINDFLYYAFSNNSDGLIMTMNDISNKWSYVQIDKNGLVIQTKEKEVISNEATTGVYYFSSGKDFIEAADSSLNNQNNTVNNEFFVCPVYNEYIKFHPKVLIYNIGDHHNGMYGLGTPEDLAIFIIDENIIKIFSGRDK